MGEYKKLKIAEVEKKNYVEEETNDKWKKFELLGEGNETSAINCVQFFPTERKLCALASGTKIKFFDLKSKEVTKAYGGFKDIVRCVAPRRDGRLFVGSDDGGRMRVIEMERRTALRRLKGHTSSIHSCRFSPNKTHVLSGSDDSTVKYWDISDGTCVCTYSEHSDFVRTTAYSNSENIFASGSYDGSIKLWDIRADNQKSILTVKHGSPVECINFFSNGLLLVSAGGNEAKTWDITGGGKLINTFRNHIHTVTCAVITEDSSAVITSSLDKTIKWNCMQTGDILRSVPCASDPLKLDISSDYFAAGMADGSWFVKNLKTKEQNENSNKRKAPSSDSFKYFTEGASDLHLQKSFLVEDFDLKKPRKIDDLLRTFKYQMAIDYAFTLPPNYTYSVIEELIQRGGLEVALRGKTEVTIQPILKFIYKQIGKTSAYLNVLLETLHTLLEVNPWIYTCKNKDTSELLKRISQKVAFEINQMNILFEIQGLLDLIESI